MTISIKKLLLLTVSSGMLVGVSIVFMGLFNVSALQGHLPGISWILHRTYDASVSRRAPPASSVPALDDQHIIELGAGHYEQGCRVCHGLPGARQSALVRAMLPAPPPIKQAVEDWQPEELFWIVKNGVKMSGMPHWPSKSRDDDVWSVIAFLQEVEAMSPANYAVLARLDERRYTDDFQTLLSGCTACHADDGKAHGNSYIPRLDIFSSLYISNALLAYRSGERFSGVMQQAASTLSDQEIQQLSDFFSHKSLKEPPDNVARIPVSELIYTLADSVPDKAEQETKDQRDSAETLLAVGKRLALGNQGSNDDELDDTTRIDNIRNMPACAACHGPWSTPLNDHYPSLVGQHINFTYQQLQLWADSSRGDDAQGLSKMHAAVPEMDERSMRGIALWYAQLNNDQPVHSSTR